MTHLQSFAAIAAALGMVVVAGSSLRVDRAEPQAPFWTLQGASPTIAQEPAAIRELRTAQRNSEVPTMTAQAD